MTDNKDILMHPARPPQDTPVQNQRRFRRPALSPNDRVVMYIVPSEDPLHPALEYARREHRETAQVVPGTTYVVAPWDDLRVLEELCVIVAAAHAVREPAR